MAPLMHAADDSGIPLTQALDPAGRRSAHVVTEQVGNMLKNSATLAWSLLLVSGAPAAAPKTWTIAQVFNQTSLIAINNSGRVIGELRVEAEPMFRPFVWHRGDLVYLPFTPVDINEPGQVVGAMAFGAHGQVTVAVLWKHGMIVYLPMLPGYTRAFPSAVNNSGQVVGRVTRWPAGAPFEESVGVLWSSGSVVALDGMGTALDINDSGQIVGSSTDGHAVLWEAGTITRLPQPHADGTSAALAINNRGQAVGYSTWGPGSTTYPAVLWDRGGPQSSCSCHPRCQVLPARPASTSAGKSWGTSRILGRLSRWSGKMVC